jgi:hypothetical protein
MSKLGLVLPARLEDWIAAIRRVRETYRQVHGRYPSLLRPRRYTEKMQWRKLFDLNPSYSIFSDKLAVRDFIAARVGAKAVVPILWKGSDPDSIPFDDLQPPYVIKSTHASRHVIRVHDRASFDKAATLAKLREWLAQDYSTVADEPGYHFVPRRIIIEPMLLGAGGRGPPLERKIFVFNGRVEIFLTHVVSKEGERRSAYHDRNWQRVFWFSLYRPASGRFPRPETLDETIAMAERVADGFDHLRIDVYECHDGVRIGEITVYSWSGLTPFKPDKADFDLGAHWRIRWPAWRAVWTVLFERREIRRAG